MFVASVLGGTFSLVEVGVSFELIVGVGFNVLFWYWIAMGAWRRTSWSSTGDRASGPESG